MAWLIEFAPHAEKDLAALDKDAVRRILNFLRHRVASLEDPRAIGEPLHGPDLGRFWKYRVGDYRIICDIAHQNIKVIVVRVGHRRQVYRR